MGQQLTDCHPELMCGVLKIEYDFAQYRGKLFMPKPDGCDMSGCLQFFCRIDPSVRLIETFSGTKPYTVYVKTGKDLEAYDAVRKAS